MTKETIVRIIGALLGVLVGILFMTIGFWRTLLIVVLAAAGWYVAGSKTLTTAVANMIERFRYSRDN